jgi:hypothetical protein
MWNDRFFLDHRRLDCESLRIALFLRPAARFSYRRSLIQSESKYGASSNGSGIVVKGSIGSGHGGWLGPRILDRICSISGRQNGEVSGSPSAITDSITAFLSCLIRARSSCASAATRASASVASSSVSPAICRANMSSCLSKLVEMRLVSPWRYAFWLDRFAPEADRGPVLFCAFRRFAAICRSLAMVQFSGPE